MLALWVWVQVEGGRQIDGEAMEFQVTFDALHPGALSEFWAYALGYELDVPPEGFEKIAADLVARGATRVTRYEADEINKGWIVMQDPEGNEFCLD